MDNDTSKTTLTNREVAARIGMTHSGVSRIRSGDRAASLRTMRAIEREFKWDIENQIVAWESGDYAAQFEKVLADAS